MIQRKRNECKRLVKVSNRIVNKIRSSFGESKAHRTTKEKICKKLEKQNKYYITEAIFNNGLRADIVVLDDFKIIEIAKTETQESLDRKKREYEKIGLKFEIVRC